MKLILMPGMDGSGVLYQPLSQSLSELGYESIVEPLNPHIDKWAYIEHLEKVYSEKSLVLIAESYSGHIAALLASRGHLNIKKIIVMASFLEQPTKLTKLESLLPARLIQKPPLPNLLLGKALFGKHSRPELLELFHKAMSDVDPAQLSQRIQDMHHLSLPDDSISLPTLYIQATDDWLVPARNYESFKQVFKHLAFSQLKGSHLIAQTQPEKCAFLIDSFIKNTE